MKRSVFRVAVGILIAYTAFTLHSCDIKDDELWERVDELFGRVEKLENACEQMNTDIHSIQSVLSAIQNNYSITSVTPLDNEEGYTITFSNGEKITINHGKDGNTPAISIKDMGNGQYAWLVNGELLRDAQGNPIPVNGQDGEDGKDGYNGSSAPTPIVKTGSELISSGINGSWDREAVYISVNGGISWTQISSGNGGSIFSSVDTSNVGYITFTLTNGIKFTVPRTDDLASLIIGEWYGYENSLSCIYLFNADGTYIKTKYNDGTTEQGHYEILDRQCGILFYDKDGDETFMDIISANANFIRAYLNRSYEHYLYRTDAFEISQTEINAPQEGGTYVIQVDAKFPFKVLETFENLQSQISGSIYTSINSELSYSTEITETSVVVNIDPNNSNLNKTAKFDIGDVRGVHFVTITINQGKNSSIQETVNLSQSGKHFIAAMIDCYGSAYSQLHSAEIDYTSGNDSDLNPELLTPYNQRLEDIWSSTYNAINQINKIINQAENELKNGPLKAPLETLRAVLYYNLAVFWGNVSYITEDNINDIGQYLSANQLFEKLIPQLKNAIDVLEERGAPVLSKYDYESIDNVIYLSKDVARMVLAKIYMYQEEYKEAEPIFQKIKSNNFYNYSYWEDSDDIFDCQGLIVYQYTDVLLGLAECKLNGDTPDDADLYIEEILAGVNWDIENTDKILLLEQIYRWGHFDSYFAFLKRNELAKETIGITEDYQLLFPIPQSEINLNPNMAQNPGY